MMFEPSSNTKAILLLTAPLIAGRRKDEPSVKPLSASEYCRFARRLRELGHQPTDLLDAGTSALRNDLSIGLDSERLERLLGRGFLLAQAVEHWRTRAIWVLSRADGGYPRRLKRHLGENAPPVLYGCGDANVLSAGGLAVVGSRNVDDTLIEYSGNVGSLVASAGRGLVSGGARGVDRAAMRGALDAGGRVVGILGDGLEKAAMLRDYREPLMDGRLALTSPYDPVARFQVGHAMQRNKLIYALADAALVVQSDYKKGGTWAGAVEQLDKLKLVPIYVRANGTTERGLAELCGLGATPWPEPDTSDALGQAIDAAMAAKQPALDIPSSTPTSGAQTPALLGTAVDPADELFEKVCELIESMDKPVSAVKVAEALQVSKAQAGKWLQRFAGRKIRAFVEREQSCITEAEVAEWSGVPKTYVSTCLKSLAAQGALEKLSRPVRYRTRGKDIFSAGQ